jgi:predicted nucleotide-binding protein (sugar kinase/HSP70/actin superfamily)
MALKRKVFYSFHYKPDVIRASQVRQIGTIEGNKSATDNEWEKITTSGKDQAERDKAIKKWIADQMENRTCSVVLVGQSTANRKWINHEIVKSWNDKKGVVGIYIHGLKNFEGEVSTKGENPFDYITLGESNKKLSSIVKCYNPVGSNSKERYAWIEKYLADAIEEAIKIRNEN